MVTSLLRIALSLSPNSNADPKIHLGSARALRNPVPFLCPPPLRRLSRPESLRLLRVNTVDIGVPAGEPQQEAAKSSSVLLDVGGMMCGACAARVQSILFADDRVESAVVNMLTETAVVRLRPGGLEDGDAGQVAEELAERLTEYGFPAKKRRSGLGVGENVRKWREMAERKEELLVRSRNRVAFAWTLVALCCGSHASHILHSLGIHVAHVTAAGGCGCRPGAATSVVAAGGAAATEAAASVAFKLSSKKKRGGRTDWAGCHCRSPPIAWLLLCEKKKRKGERSQPDGEEEVIGSGFGF